MFYKFQLLLLSTLVWSSISKIISLAASVSKRLYSTALTPSYSSGSQPPVVHGHLRGGPQAGSNIYLILR